MGACIASSAEGADLFDPALPPPLAGVVAPNGLFLALPLSVMWFGVWLISPPLREGVLSCGVKVSLLPNSALASSSSPVPAAMRF